jgi:hypothetical protein
LALATLALKLSSLALSLAAASVALGLGLAAALALTTSLPLAATRPQRATVRIAQEQRLAGSFVIYLAGLEHAVFIETGDNDLVAGVEGDSLLAGKAGHTQVQGQFTLLGRIDGQALLVAREDRAGQGYPIVLYRLGHTCALALTVALALTTPLALTLALPLTTPLALTLASIALALAGGE